MPNFEATITITGQTKNGKEITISPTTSMHRAGPCFEVAISVSPAFAQKLKEQKKPFPDPVSGLALIDTGATFTAVDESVCKQLGLPAVGVRNLCDANGHITKRLCYPVMVQFPPPLGYANFTSMVSCNLQAGEPKYVLLFGRDLLRHCKLIYNGQQGRFEISV